MTTPIRTPADQALPRLLTCVDDTSTTIRQTLNWPTEYMSPPAETAPTPLDERSPERLRLSRIMHTAKATSTLRRTPRSRPGQRLRHSSSDVGTISVEMILGAVIVVAVICLGIGAGILTLANGRVDAAAATAARAATLETSPQAAIKSASAMAASTLEEAGASCQSRQVIVDTDDFRPGGRVTVTVRCQVDLSIVSLAGFAPTRDLQATASAPLDSHRAIQAQP